MHMRRSIVGSLVLGIGVVFALSQVAAADNPPFVHVGTVTEPASSLNGGFGSFDISYVDTQREEYLLADRAGVDASGNFVHGRIVMVDTRNGSLMGFIGADTFAGNYNNPGSGVSDCAEAPRDPRNGPNGVLTDPDGFIWVGDGNHAAGGCANGSLPTDPSTIKVFDQSGNMVANISNGGNRRADELAFGRTSSGAGRVLMGNPEEVKPGFPFMTMLDADNRSIIGKIMYDSQPASGAALNTVPPAGHGWDSSLQDTDENGGLEQDVFDPSNGMFYLNVPATTLNPGGEIDVISADSGNIVKVLPLDKCGGTGLALAGDMLASQCGDDIRVVDKNSGREIQRFTQGGGADEIWYDPADGNVYQGLIGMPVTPQGGVGVLDLQHLTYVGVIPTASGTGTHSVAAGGTGNRIYYPMGFGTATAKNLGNGGIVMFQHQ